MGGFCGLKQKSLIFPEKSLSCYQMNKEDLIIKLLEEFKADVNRRFEQVEEARREDRAEMARRFEQAEIARKEDRSEWQKAREEDRAEWRRSFEEIKYDLRLDKEKLQEVYESRDRVTVSFTRAWASASFFIALSASTIVLAVAKAF